MKIVPTIIVLIALAASATSFHVLMHAFAAKDSGFAIPCGMAILLHCLGAVITLFFYWEAHDKLVEHEAAQT